MINIMKKSILAGALIGVGDIALITNDSKIIGAFIFSVALLSIIQLKLPLYTGRIGFVTEKRNFAELFYILVSNIFGTVLVCDIYAMIARGNTGFVSVAESKFSKPFLSLFLAGVMCNVLIHIAVTAKREIITVLCIMAFILCGFEHSIADIGYVALSFKPYYYACWAFVLLGNTAGGIATELLVRGE